MMNKLNSMQLALVVTIPLVVCLFAIRPEYLTIDKLFLSAVVFYGGVLAPLCYWRKEVLQFYVMELPYGEKEGLRLFLVIFLSGFSLLIYIWMMLGWSQP